MANIDPPLADDDPHSTHTSPTQEINTENHINLSHENGNGAWRNVEFADIKLLQASPLLSADVSFEVDPLLASTPDLPRFPARKYHSVRLMNGEDSSSSAYVAAVTCGGAEDFEDVEKPIEVVDQVHVPIVGYETIEERAKFTVFKLEVKKSPSESWHIFRRYSDFERLKRQVKRILPEVRMKLPPKKWFGDNFETIFLDERMAGLQIFINDVLTNKRINTCAPVRQFFCFDEPPGPYESLEESRAMCESFEDQIYRLTVQLQQRDNRIQTLEGELKESREKISEMERTKCSCGLGIESSTKLTREVDSNENLTEQS